MQHLAHFLLTLLLELLLNLRESDVSFWHVHTEQRVWYDLFHHLLGRLNLLFARISDFAIAGGVAHINELLVVGISLNRIHKHVDYKIAGRFIFDYFDVRIDKTSMAQLIICGDISNYFKQLRFVCFTDFFVFSVCAEFLLVHFSRSSFDHASVVAAAVSKQHRGRLAVRDTLFRVGACKPVNDVIHFKTGLLSHLTYDFRCIHVFHGRFDDLRHDLLRPLLVPFWHVIHFLQTCSVLDVHTVWARFRLNVEVEHINDDVHRAGLPGYFHHLVLLAVRRDLFFRPNTYIITFLMQAASLGNLFDRQKEIITTLLCHAFVCDSLLHDPSVRIHSFIFERYVPFTAVFQFTGKRRCNFLYTCIFAHFWTGVYLAIWLL